MFFRNFFYAFGEIKSIVVVHKSKCAFVNFATRASAELAADKSFNNLNINGAVLRVQWGKPKPQGPKSDLLPNSSGQVNLDMLGSLPPPPGAAGGFFYPSTDPSVLGTAMRSFKP